MKDPLSQQWGRLRELTLKWTNPFYWQQLAETLQEARNAGQKAHEYACKRAKAVGKLKTETPETDPNYYWWEQSEKAYGQESQNYTDEETIHLRDNASLQSDLQEIEQLVAQLCPQLLGKTPVLRCNDDIRDAAKNCRPLAEKMLGLYGEVLAVEPKLATPSATGETNKGNRKKRGAPVTTDEKKDKRLCDDWKAAKKTGSTRASFARDRNIAVNDLIGALDRVKYRRIRDAE